MQISKQIKFIKNNYFIIITDENSLQFIESRFLGKFRLLIFVEIVNIFLLSKIEFLFILRLLFYDKK